MENATNFNVDDRVILHNTTYYDGKIGSIVGVYLHEHESYPGFYIVLLDEPLERGDKAIVMASNRIKLV